MAEKVLKTRIALLYKTYAQWDEIKSTFTPRKGEVCICAVPASTGAVVQEPAVLFKVGDGANTFAALPWTSANAADVYAWAKKASLDFTDLDATFLEALDARIASVAPQQDTQYQIVADGTNKWKLQKSTDYGTTWVDATGVIDLSSTIAGLEAAIATKTDREIIGTNGKALIFNEADGGGAKFEHNDGTWSGIAVNDGGANGIAAQIYAINSQDTSKGVKLNIEKGRITYIKNKATNLRSDDDELVVKSDIAGLVGGMHYLGKVEKQAGESDADAIARKLQELQHTPISGDIILVDNKEYIYDGTTWDEMGNEGDYATHAELSEEITARQDADNAEETARIAADNALSTRIDTKTTTSVTGTNGTSLIFNESDGGGAKFEHVDGTESFVGVNDGGENGLVAQIYADKLVDGKWTGAKLDVTHGGMYYTVGNDRFADRAVAANEVAVKGDLADCVMDQDTVYINCNAAELS